MASTAPRLTDLSAEKLSRLDARVAAARAVLDRAEQERTDLARSWGYRNGYRMAVSPDQMRMALGSGS